MAISLTSIFFIYSFLFLLPTIQNIEHYGYTLEHQYQALETIRKQPYAIDPVGIDIFVPNLLPIQYQYINQRLNQQIEHPQVEVLITGEHREYYLISEPAFAGASEIAHQQWRQRAVLNADCEVIGEFGIITVERCSR